MLRRNLVLIEEEREAVGEIRQILIERAKVRGTIPYQELVRKVQATRLAPRSIRLFHILGLISSGEVKKGRGMLTAVVVQKNGAMEPGSGFYALAKRLGYKVKNPKEFWLRELNRIYVYWRGKP